MKKIIAALGLLLTLAACASNSYVAPVAADRKATIKTIGVASIVGDKMYFTRIGITIFDTERTSGDTSAWGIDEGVTQALTARLKDRYSIVPIAIDRTCRLLISSNPTIWALPCAARNSHTGGSKTNSHRPKTGLHSHRSNWIKSKLG